MPMRIAALAAGLAALVALAPGPAAAHGRRGPVVGFAYPAPVPYYAPRPYYAPPPAYAVPPPVFYAPPPVVYAPPPPVVFVPGYGPPGYWGR